MARFQLFLITAVTLLLLESCAEIVPLTGGEEDTTAPRIIRQKPEQGMTYYTGNSIVVTFDEYVRLNDPVNTITVNPAGPKITPKLKNRTLTLSWDGLLQSNTTYIIQFNGTVRDFNEANDSIMQFVFSTGAVIDSLKLSGKAVGAFSNAHQNQLTVGLYSPDSNPLQAKPLYATRTNAQGEFQFNYLKSENYQVFAFLDANKDQRVQPNEPVAFSDSIVTPADTAGPVLRVFPPVPVKDAPRATFAAPGMLIVHNRDSLDASRLFVNGENPELLEVYSPDSMAFALPPAATPNYTIAYDTLSFIKPITPAERTVPLTILREGRGKWKPGDTLHFRINDRIASVDTSLISITTIKGNRVNYSLLQQRKSGFSMVPDPRTDASFEVQFGKHAVQTHNLKSDTTRFSYTTLLSADLSNLTINCADLPGQWIIELTQNERVLYYMVKLPSDTAVVFRQIEPGQYTARCIADVNRNGKWDTGNFVTKAQPEEVKRFALTQKLRANWDVEETLTAAP